VHQILAVLERRGGVTLSNSEVYVTVMGGIRTDDPATDLAIAAAVVSAATDTALPSVAAFGELGLTGEVRPAQQSDVRVAECHRLGIETVLAAPNLKRIDDLVGAVRSTSNAPSAGDSHIASANGRDRPSLLA
jgi:DNA repair protein RadA/Sms